MRNMCWNLCDFTANMEAATTFRIYLYSLHKRSTYDAFYNFSEYFCRMPPAGPRHMGVHALTRQRQNFLRK